MRELERIRRLRGLSQNDLAVKAGVVEGTVTGIELGRHTPRASTARKLAGALGVDVADLYGETLPKAPVPATPASEAVADAQRFRDEAKGRLDRALSAWEVTPDKEERRPYLDEAARILDEGNEWIRALLANLGEGINRFPEGPNAYLQEVGAAESFYEELVRRTEAAGLQVSAKVSADAAPDHKLEEAAA